VYRLPGIKTNPKDTKMTFSDTELAILNGKKYIDTKNRLLYQMNSTLQELRTNLAVDSKLWSIDKDLLINSGKISRGENHKGYPYLVLDYPRNFAKSSIFSLRNLFWWGHFYSTTLHISGNQHTSYLEHLVKKTRILKEKEFFISNTSNRWENNLENYISLDLVDDVGSFIEQRLNQHNFIRITRILSITSLNKCKSFTQENASVLFC
jgi:hypothetical protein